MNPAPPVIKILIFVEVSLDNRNGEGAGGDLTSVAIVPLLNT
jgi:hypothetical protein